MVWMKALRSFAQSCSDSYRTCSAAAVCSGHGVYGCGVREREREARERRERERERERNKRLHSPLALHAPPYTGLYRGV